MKPKIILASASPRRKKLLQQLNLDFEVQVSSVNEEYDTDLSPVEVVLTLAHRKALDVSTKFNEALVIGSDTIVTYNNSILEKPSTVEEARGMLHQLSGTTHSVLTGVSLCKKMPQGDPQVYSFYEETRVTFGSLRRSDIDNYVQSGSPMDKAGAYGIQDDYGAIFVKRIEGDYNNVVGFPLYSFYQSMIHFASEYL